MSRRLLGLAVVAVLLGSASSARAQLFGGANDPFTIYYGFWLPRQAALAVTPRPEMIVNNMAAIRQQSAMTDRSGLFEPVSPFGGNVDQSMMPFATRGLSNRARHGGNINGMGPPGYFNRSAAYYPGLRLGRGTNSGIAAGGSPGGNRNMSAIGMPSTRVGMPSAGMSMPR